MGETATRAPGSSTSRADDTRRRLVEQGRIAFAAKGHDGVSLQRDVLQASGVSNGSFYHQFADKTDLLVAVLEDAAETGRSVLQQSIGSTPITDPEDAVRRAFETWFHMVDAAEDVFRIQIRERENPDPRVRAMIRQYRQRWVATIAAALRERTVSNHADLAARLIASLTDGVLADYLDTPVDERAAVRATLIDALPRFVAGGVAGLDAGDASSGEHDGASER
jgi:AcrR family transcriptional regulator